jgi:hypothetical protein
MNPKLSLSLIASLVLLAVIATVVGAQAQESPGAATSTTAPAAPDVVALQQAYTAHLAADQTAQATAVPPPTDEELAASNFGCPDGTVFWLRDPETPICAPLCTSDSDCGPNEGRCRLLDVGNKSLAPPLLLVDDMSADEVTSVIARSNPPAVPVCDPLIAANATTVGG